MALLPATQAPVQQLGLLLALFLGQLWQLIRPMQPGPRSSGDTIMPMRSACIRRGIKSRVLRAAQQDHLIRRRLLLRQAPLPGHPLPPGVNHIHPHHRLISASGVSQGGPCRGYAFPISDEREVPEGERSVGSWRSSCGPAASEPSRSSLRP